MQYMKLLSALNIGISSSFSGRHFKFNISTTVTAAASEPSSFTSMNALCITSEI